MSKEEKKKRSSGVSKFYKVSDDGQTLKRLKRFCPRCGPGWMMAEMYDRIVCGHCGFTEFKKKPAKKMVEEEEEVVEDVEEEGAQENKEVEEAKISKPSTKVKEESKPIKKKKK